jgi:DnaJ-class molecular chaperone
MPDGSTRHEQSCPACHGYGAGPCGRCEGTGQILHDEPGTLDIRASSANRGVRALSSRVTAALHWCPDCNGAGAIGCIVCHGKGRRGQTPAFDVR